MGAATHLIYHSGLIKEANNTSFLNSKSRILVLVQRLNEIGKCGGIFISPFHDLDFKRTETALFRKNHLISSDCKTKRRCRGSEEFLH